jgi:glycopeptide antibiotics resistance protein
MLRITYAAMVAFISLLWIFNRAIVWKKNKSIVWKREAQLLLVYICLIVVARFVFFPFSTVNGKVQPLLFDTAQIWPFRINLVPFVHLFDYPKKSEIILNVVGNTTMFVPVGIIWPLVYKKLDTHGKVLAAGAGFSLTIEMIQLLFYDRVTDIDDLILNTLGYAVGYGIYLFVKVIKDKRVLGNNCK